MGWTVCNPLSTNGLCSFGSLPYPLEPTPMIVTIDGPAGAGKSSAARGLADRLGFQFLDTGAMYRAVTLAAMRQGLDWHDPRAIAKLAESIELVLTGDRVLVDGEDVTEAIRSFDVTSHTRFAADNRAVRARLVALQREYAKGKDVVTEGRDQATVVFPESTCKIYLTAGEEERARRRHLDLLAQGESIRLEEVLTKQRQRDDRDRNRKVGGLFKTPESIEVCTDGLSPEAVVDRLVAIVRSVEK